MERVWQSHDDVARVSATALAGGGAVRHTCPSCAAGSEKRRAKALAEGAPAAAPCGRTCTTLVCGGSCSGPPPGKEESTRPVESSASAPTRSEAWRASATQRAESVGGQWRLVLLFP